MNQDGGASLTKQHLFNVFKVEILSLTEAEGWGGIKEGKMENRTRQGGGARERRIGGIK